MKNLTNYSNPQYVFNNNEGVMSINIQNKFIYDNTQNRKFNRKIEFTKNEMYSNSNINSNLNSRSYPIKTEKEESGTESSDSANHDSEEIKKPQPIVPPSMSKISESSKESIYLHPFQPYSDSIANNLKMYSFSKMTSVEYQKKTQEELEKKKFFCNCKKSKCLKLYCECFANGEFCINCNCQDCSNVIGNEEEKDEAFKSIKDKNPVAMKLNNNKEVAKEETLTENKIGCNCTKSNCSKKYCECYKANVQCTEQCRCRDCENSSMKCRENKRKIMLQQDFSDIQMYDYQNFIVEKISVLIENKNIFVNKLQINNISHFSIEKSNFDKIPNNSNSNNSAIYKRVGDSFIIEFSKSIVNVPLPLSQTPVINKFKKRRRNDSENSNDFSATLTKTACDTTSKKINNRKNLGESKVIGKKLILDG